MQKVAVIYSTFRVISLNHCVCLYVLASEAHISMSQIFYFLIKFIFSLWPNCLTCCWQGLLLIRMADL